MASDTSVYHGMINSDVQQMAEKREVGLKHYQANNKMSNRRLSGNITAGETIINSGADLDEEAQSTAYPWQAGRYR